MAGLEDPSDRWKGLSHQADYIGRFADGTIYMAVSEVRMNVQEARSPLHDARMATGTLAMLAGWSGE
ncbi:hypothetical protein GCM10027081_38430 [Cupriavidus yeoncheonensis]